MRVGMEATGNQNAWNRENRLAIAKSGRGQEQNTDQSEPNSEGQSSPMESAKESKTAWDYRNPQSQAMHLT